MTSGLIQDLAHASRVIAYHPDPSARFGMAVGFLCDIALQNDFDGLSIAVERGVLGYVHKDDEEDMARGLRVPRIRNALGEVVDLQIHISDWVGHEYVELAREIALLDDRQTRIVVLEAAAIHLIQDSHEQLTDLLAGVKLARAERLPIDAFGGLLARQQLGEGRSKFGLDVGAVANPVHNHTEEDAAEGGAV